jgi:hypothetical protein
MQRTEMENMERKGSYNCEMRKMNTEIKVERNEEKKGKE